MAYQLILPEVYNQLSIRAVRYQLLTEIMEDLTGEYEKLLSPTLVKQYKCRSISKILDEAYMYHTYEDFLLIHLKISKRMYNKTLSEITKVK